MSYSDEQRAVVEALGLSPDDLRGLAGALESNHVIVSIREVAATHLATLPDHHRYAKSLHRVISWAGDDDAAAVQPSDVTSWALRAGREARTDAKARHGVGAQEAMILATRAAFAHAIESGLIRHNPACRVALPDRPPSRRGALSADQLAQVHFALVAHSRDPELDDLVFGFLRETGSARPLGLVAEASYDDPYFAALSSSQKRDCAAFLHVARTRPDFLSWRVDDLPHAAPSLFSALGGKPVLVWTVRTAAQWALAREFADQAVFEGRPASDHVDA